MTTATITSAAPRAKRSLSSRLRRIGTIVLAVVFCIVWIFPVYWMFVTSLKPRNQIMTATPVFWPAKLSIDNFMVAVTQTSFLTNLKNLKIRNCLTRKSENSTIERWLKSESKIKSYENKRF